MEEKVVSDTASLVTIQFASACEAFCSLRSRAVVEEVIALRSG